MPPNKDLGGTTKGGADLPQQIGWLTWISGTIAVVLLLAVGGFIQLWMAGKQASYEALAKVITEQNVKIDTLIQQCSKEKTASSQAVPNTVNNYYAQPPAESAPQAGQVQNTAREGN